MGEFAVTWASDAVIRAIRDLAEHREKQRKNRYPIGHQIHDEIVIEAPVIAQVDHYYLHERRKVPVKIISKRRQIWAGNGYAWMYLAKNMCDGSTLNVEKKELSEELNEMEVLAWAARG